MLWNIVAFLSGMVAACSFKKVGRALYCKWYERRRREFVDARWVETAAEGTNLEVNLFSGAKVIATLPPGALYTHKSGLASTHRGYALIMAFFNEDGSSILGQFFVKSETANFLRKILKQNETVYIC